jgi:hypothetical protein
VNIKIIIATHKEYKLPHTDIYLPIQVGKANTDLDLGMQTDDEGENISYKNAKYCELTAIYWAWKNLDADYIGLMHYRRFFVGQRNKNKLSVLLTESELEKLLHSSDILLPNKRNYFIETNYSHYIHSHESEGLDQTIEIITEFFPDYVAALDKVMKRTWAHMFNMLIMKRDIFDAYCTWLFDVLEKLEMQLDISDYTAFEARLFGRIGELLLNVWVEKNELRYLEVPVRFMEKQNWVHKGGMFLLRKTGIIRKNEIY